MKNKSVRLELTFRQLSERLTNTGNLLNLIESSVGRDLDVIESLKKTLTGSKEPKVERYIATYYASRNIHSESPTNPASYVRSLNLIMRLEKQALKTALELSLIHLCVAYEEYIIKVLLRFYRDDIVRLKNEDKIYSNDDIISLLDKKLNLHQHMAERATRSLSYKSVNDWHMIISKKMGIEFKKNEVLNEMFLIRNCIVHSGSVIGEDLHVFDPKKYKIRESIVLDREQFDLFSSTVHKTAKYLQMQFDSKFKKKSKWLSN